MQTLNYQDGLELILRLTTDNNLKPVIGSGFTKNCKATNGTVPDGKTLNTQMRKYILEADKGYTKDELTGLSLTKISEYFFSEVSRDVQLKFYAEYFTGVNLPQDKVSFLQTYWPYIYTLNVDDAIENSTDFEVVLPYSNFNKNFSKYSKNKMLIKLHGDAKHEIKYNADDNMVFSHTQYISSLISNKNESLKNFLYSDFKMANLIFIGCSLADELDIKQIYTDIRKDESLSTYRIQIRSTTPKQSEIRELSNHGINTIIEVDNYDKFYNDFVEQYNKILPKKPNLHPNLNPKIDTITSADSIMKYMAGYQAFNAKSNHFKKPSTIVNRKKLKQLQDYLKRSCCCIIKGRRFSGKTFFLCSLIENTSTHSKYFFPTMSNYDESYVMPLFKENKDTIFIFDSNSLNKSLYLSIAHSKNILDDNNNKVIVASNNNEDYLIDKLGAKVVTLSPKLEKEELIDFNDKADKLAFNKRLPDDTNLDYIYKLLEQQKSKISLPIAAIDYKQLTQNEKKIFLLLSANDKIDYHEFIALDINIKDVHQVIDRYDILLEESKNTPLESKYSQYRLIHNSKALLLKVLHEYSKEEIIDIIYLIVTQYNKDSRLDEEKKKLIFFDTLNQLFNVDSGAAYLIEGVYSKLEKALYSNPHFWLQRAKSIYRLFRKNKNKLEEALIYAKKVFNDTGEQARIHQRNKLLNEKSALSASLIYCLLADLETESFHKENYQKSAIEMAFVAVNSDNFKYKPDIFKSDLNYTSDSISVNHHIYSVCKDYINLKVNSNTSKMAHDVIHKLKEFQREHIEEDYE